MTNVLTGTAHYPAVADNDDDAIAQADNWLGMLMAWNDPSSPEDYDIDHATVIDAAPAAAHTATAQENGQRALTVLITVTYTAETNANVRSIITPAS